MHPVCTTWRELFLTVKVTELFSKLVTRRSGILDWDIKFRKDLNYLLKKVYLEAKDVDTLGLCENCVFEEAHERSFKKGNHTSKETFQYVHPNLWGILFFVWLIMLLQIMRNITLTILQPTILPAL